MKNYNKLQCQLGDSGILRITLNDPSKRNALSEQMMADLTDCLHEAEHNNQVRVMILSANGHVFSSGHDLKELTAHRSDPDKGRAYFEQTLSTCSALMQAITLHKKPIIAEVNGIATAAGCQLVASCDLAVASKQSLFSTPGVHIGLFCSTPMVALSRNIGNKHAMEMLLTGEMIKAKKAQKIGLINCAVKADKLTEKTQAMAEIIASKSMHTLAIGKSAFYEQKQMTLEEAYRYASQVMVNNMLDADAQEGIGAFLEKRTAVWQDK